MRCTFVPFVIMLFSGAGRLSMKNPRPPFTLIMNSRSISALVFDVISVSVDRTSICGSEYSERIISRNIRGKITDIMSGGNDETNATTAITPRMKTIARRVLSHSLIINVILVLPTCPGIPLQLTAPISLHTVHQA